MSVKLSNSLPRPLYALAESWLLAMGREPVLLLDTETGTIVDANPAAAQLLKSRLAGLPGASLASLISPIDIAVLERAQLEARETGRSAPITVRRGADAVRLELTYSFVRSDAAEFWLVLMRDPVAIRNGIRDSSVWPGVLESLEDANEGFFVTNLAFQIEYANSAFLKLVQLEVPAQVIDTLAMQWLHFTVAQLRALGTQLAERQAVTFLITALRCASGLNVTVDVRAVAVPDGDFPCWGFMVCPREAPLAVEPSPVQHDTAVARH
jgi:PAS domain-containing protein